MKKKNFSLLEGKLQSLSGLNHALIVSHDNPDPDSLASSWGLAFLLKKNLGINSTITYGGLIGRAENRAMVKVLKIPLVPFTPTLIQEHNAILMVDCQPHTGNSSLPEESIPDMVIDHHPLRETTHYKRWAYVDEKKGATSSIISSFIKEQNLPVSKRLATALFYAIRSETKDLGWEGSKEDYENYLFLLPQVDFKALHQITYPPLPSDYYQCVKKAVEKSLIYKFILVSPLDKVPYPELPAEIADFLILKENVDLALVTGLYEGDLYLSMRSLKKKYHTAQIMHKIIQGYGSGGGHTLRAGGKIPHVSTSKAKEIQQTMIHRSLKEFSLTRVKPTKLS
ncbi:DHH family phosphoesterase [bacterium]|nr:DHH family phosphoesterase [bacterium]